MTRKVVFLDRDGVINYNRDKDYVKSYQELRFFPWAKESLRLLHENDFDIIVITNQAGIGKGLLTLQEMEEINSRFVKEIEDAGGKIKAIYYCPHLREDGCECRKPKAGLLYAAAREHGINLSQAVIVGDSIFDIEAGDSAGCSVKILVKTGRGGEFLSSRETWRVRPDFVVENLAEATRLLLNLLCGFAKE